MKKTFKVKNILENKNKYNFKTELLLSALSLLVAFGTVSCKKDPVKPKNNTETPVVPPKSPEELKQENLKKLDSLAHNAKYITKDISKVFDKNFKNRFNNEYMPMVKDKYIATILTYKSIVDVLIITYGNVGKDIPNKETMMILHEKCVELLKEANYNEKTNTFSNSTSNIQRQR